MLGGCINVLCVREGGSVSLECGGGWVSHNVNCVRKVSEV